jgi:hypothetical protein
MILNGRFECRDKRLGIGARVDRQFPVGVGGIANSDILKSYLGLLVQVKNDFDAIEAFRGDEFFTRFRWMLSRCRLARLCANDSIPMRPRGLNWLENSVVGPRHSNDNGLAEMKNGVVVRKIFGYGHISQRHAAPINTFSAVHLTPLLNRKHRPCLFATERRDPKKPERVHKVYRPQDAMTRLEKLASLPKTKQGLRNEVNLKNLLAQAAAKTDLQAAGELNAARQALFDLIPKSTLDTQPGAMRLAGHPWGQIAPTVDKPPATEQACGQPLKAGVACPPLHNRRLRPDALRLPICR